MAAAKPKSRKAAPSKGAAARAEKKGESPVVDFRGLEITLPEKISGTLLWDFYDLFSGNERSLGGFVGLLESLLGGEQSLAIRNKVREDGLDIEETFSALEDLLGKIFETSGLSLGE